MTPFRVRFAPSPTGYLHVGGARTALFNYLFARGHNGVFVLRIEDTDPERSSAEMVEGILEGLRWLGVEWDEGPGAGGPHAPYFQSQRFDRHRAVARQLLAAGAAYYCYCSQDELKAKRNDAEKASGGWIYDRTCCALSPEDVALREREGRPRAIRVKMPSAPIRFNDIVRGPIEFAGALIEDFVIVRSDGTPTYQLSVVADDVDMQITHVVRGDDHISNTPKQIALYRALGVEPPVFAHVPLILGPDKKRLSKRHGATSVTEYRTQGCLPEAMVNFLALLGWSPGSGDREIFTKSELIDVFDLSGISGGNAVFNPEKLDWFNQQHIARLTSAELAVRLQPLFQAAGMWNDAYLGQRRDWFFAVLEQLKPRAKRLDEFVALGRFFFEEKPEYDAAAVDKHLRANGTAAYLTALDDAIGKLASFDVSSTEAALRAVAESLGMKAGTLIHAARVALTGRTVSPGLFDVMVLLGRERTLARLRAAVDLANRA